MAIDGIKISTGEVAKTAETIRNLNTQLESRLQDIKKEMNALESTWQSEGSTTIRNKFNALEVKFQDYKAIINSYAKFLDINAQSYDSTESAITSNANSFK